MNVGEWTINNTIHKIIAGSHLYGTATENSDIDIRGVCLMPPQALLGLVRFDQFQEQVDEDVVIYGLTKFFQLALNANPNIMDILYAPSDTWLVDTAYWRLVYDNRFLFLSQKIRHTFSGYACAQLKRIKGHRRWLVDPPQQKPVPEDFRGHVEQGPKGEQKLIFPDLQYESEYQAAMKEWGDYQRWKRERNPKRVELEAKYGYDVKHASHLVRLMMQADNILTNCDYQPRLPYYVLGVVRDVMDGKWEYDYLISFADDMDTRISRLPTRLPHSPDRKAIENLLMSLNVKSLENFKV